MINMVILEDDKNLNKGLVLTFKDKYNVKSATSIEDGEKYIKNCDLLLLDMNLPDGDGLDVISKLRKSSNIPIIVLSARDMEMDIVTAIQMGADDYITKPFSLGILQAKVERILKRLENLKNKIYKSENLYFDFTREDFYLNNEKIYFTVTEEKILYYLIESKNKIVSRKTLLEKIWSVDESFIDENTLSVHINRIRKKLDFAEFIETIYGVGYRWKEL